MQVQQQTESAKYAREPKTSGTGPDSGWQEHILARLMVFIACSAGQESAT
jgi:hypothetical protein